MIYLLDTNVVIQHINQRVPRLVARFILEGDAAIATSAITVAELSYGVARSSNPTRTRELREALLRRIHVVPFTRTAAGLFGGIRRDLEVRGEMIGQFDLQIACTALANNLILVTHNTREFSRVEGLRFEDWEI